MTDTSQLKEGARNLLKNCANLQTGESLLVIYETPEEGWYDQRIVDTVVATARDLGFEPALLAVGAPVNEDNPAVTEAISHHDCTIFLTRLGDQDRFAKMVPGQRTVMVYTRTADMLASNYGTTPHQAMEDLKGAIHDVMREAREIVITCPLGTHLTGDTSQTVWEDTGDVSVKRFPLGVPQPIGAASFSGQVALNGYLTTTGCKVYTPDHAALDGIAFAHVENGRIEDFTGPAKTVKQIKQHYHFVSDLFGIDPDFIHSWHAGMHPGCTYLPTAAAHPDRWSNSVFTHPQFVHFHTCGAYAPGEICWMVKDQTIIFDGIALWDRGRMMPASFPVTSQCLERWPILLPLFANPSANIGLY